MNLVKKLRNIIGLFFTEKEGFLIFLQSNFALSYLIILKDLHRHFNVIAQCLFKRSDINNFYMVHNINIGITDKNVNIIAIIIIWHKENILSFWFVYLYEMFLSEKLALFQEMVTSLQRLGLKFGARKCFID